MKKSVRVAVISVLVLAVMAIAAYSVLAAPGLNMDGRRGGLAVWPKAAESKANAADELKQYAPDRSDHLPGCDDSEGGYEVDEG